MQILINIIVVVSCHIWLEVSGTHMSYSCHSSCDHYHSQASNAAGMVAQAMSSLLIHYCDGSFKQRLKRRLIIKGNQQESKYVFKIPKVCQSLSRG